MHRVKAKKAAVLTNQNVLVKPNKKPNDSSEKQNTPRWNHQKLYLVYLQYKNNKTNVQTNIGKISTIQVCPSTAEQ